MKIKLLAFTDKGKALNKTISSHFEYTDIYLNNNGLELKQWVKEAFDTKTPIIFTCAAGIAVRLIAPYLKTKNDDPPVIVIDENARYVIPILSGHIGGANKLSQYIAGILGADAVITTSTDINGVFSPDLWAAENDCEIYDISQIKYVSSALIKHEDIGIVSDYEIKGQLPQNVNMGKGYNCGIVISDKISAPYCHTLNIIPKCFAAGVGSRKNACGKSLIELFESTGFLKQSFYAVATIDIKKGEKSIENLADYLGVEIVYYSSKELMSVKGDFSSSELVKKVTGADNVCERAASLCTKGNIILKKTIGKGVTIAVSKKNWSVCFESNNVRD